MKLEPVPTQPYFARLLLFALALVAHAVAAQIFEPWTQSAATPRAYTTGSPYPLHTPLDANPFDTATRRVWPQTVAEAEPSLELHVSSL